MKEKDALEIEFKDFLEHPSREQLSRTIAHMGVFQDKFWDLDDAKTETSFLCTDCGEFPTLLREDHDGGEFGFCRTCDKFLFAPEQTADVILEKPFMEILEFIAPTNSK